MKKLIALLLCLLSFCVLLFTFTACTKDPIVGSYCGQIEGSTFTSGIGNPDNEGVEYAYWQISQEDGKLLVYYYIYHKSYRPNNGNDWSMGFQKMSNNGRTNTDGVKFIELTKNENNYTGTAKCNMIDSQEYGAGNFTYTVTLDNNTLTIACTEDATGNVKTYILTATNLTHTEYDTQLYREVNGLV